MKDLPPIGSRVRRLHAYQNANRVLTGNVMRHYTAPDSNGSQNGPPTHVVVNYDDGRNGVVHPTALELIAPPRPVPAFASLEEADAWLESAAVCLHVNVVTTYNSTLGTCLDCEEVITLTKDHYVLRG